MKSGLALLLTVDTFEKLNELICISHIVSEDNSTIKLHCTNIRHGGKLPNKILQPDFLTDPSHKIKCMLNSIFNLCTSLPVEDPGHCKNVNGCRLKNYTAYFVPKN